jgi:hypothetical protein
LRRVDERVSGLPALRRELDRARMDRYPSRGRLELRAPLVAPVSTSGARAASAVGDPPTKTALQPSAATRPSRLEPGRGARARELSRGRVVRNPSCSYVQKSGRRRGTRTTAIEHPRRTRTPPQPHGARPARRRECAEVPPAAAVAAR